MLNGGSCVLCAATEASVVHLRICCCDGVIVIGTREDAC